MEKAFVCHFYAIGWFEVNKMPFSEFTRMYKCAAMISANERLGAINISNFAHLKEEARTKVVRELREAASEFMEKKVKDYREVLGGLAKRMLNGR